MCLKIDHGKQFLLMWLSNYFANKSMSNTVSLRTTFLLNLLWHLANFMGNCSFKLNFNLLSITIFAKNAIYYYVSKQLILHKGHFINWHYEICLQLVLASFCSLSFSSRMCLEWLHLLNFHSNYHKYCISQFSSSLCCRLSTYSTSPMLKLLYAILKNYCVVIVSEYQVQIK